jgi:NAD(P)-dependent dehydrogenase (short-subunit alcohol dehydrogenase family)
MFERVADFRRLFDLSGRTAVVVGGAGIQGPDYARGLMAHGANVVVADLARERCEEVARVLNSEAPGQALAHPVDVASEGSIAELVGFVLERRGRVDVVVNAAATKSPNFFAPLEEFPRKDWDEVMAVNLAGAFYVCQAFGREMIRAGRGSLINIASTTGVIGADKRVYEGSEYAEVAGKGRPINTPPVYTASKGGLIALTRQLAVHWAEHGVRVNCISPAGIYSGQNARFVERYSSRIPLGRMAHRHEVVGAVVFLASDASSFITGHNLLVDGGMTAW